jgi:S1-C subfamily serine protease
MKLFTILVLFACAIFLNSCAAILCSRNQEVSISIPTQNTILRIDSNYIGTGTSFKPILVKSFDNKQLRFEAEGYKTSYNVLVADSKSNYHILSWLPFIVVYAPYFDNGSNTWNYDDSYTMPPLRKYINSDSNHKRLYVNNVGFEINKKNFISNTYPYGYYLDHSDPTITRTLDSVGVPSTVFDASLDELLKKLNYKDTLNTVFIDNINTLSLDAKIVKYVNNYVVRRYSGVGTVSMGNYNSFIETKLSTLWILKNIYGDTLSFDTITSTSGQFSNDYYKNEVSTQKSIEDALETSMLDYLDLLAKKNTLALESTKITFNEPIKISKPSKSPTNIAEGMKASVTIKHKDGHGSGFLISNDGYIITNHHVVGQPKDYSVVLNDGTEHKAKVVRSNKAIDLALIKIEGEFEVAYSLPEKQNFRIGDEVITIGTPKSLQLGQSVAKGIVSGTRKNKGMNYIQTDISINRGNSGGPIILKSGELTGVVEYKLFGQGTEGLSFSIPAYDIIQSLNLSY